MEEKTSGKTLVSYSQLSTYNQCAHRWKLKYIDKLSVSKDSIHLLFGTSMHTTLQTYLDSYYNKTVAEADALDLNKMLLNENERILPMIFFSNLFSAIFIIFIPNTLGEAMKVNFFQISLLFFLGIGANLILFCIIKAFSKAPASFLAPMRYLELLMSIAIGFLFFKEVISINILLGGVLIILSSIIINHKIQDKINVEKV